MALYEKNGIWHSTWREWAIKTDSSGKPLLDKKGKEIWYWKQRSKAISPDKDAAKQYERTRKTNCYHKKSGLTLVNISIRQFFEEYINTVSIPDKEQNSVIRDRLTQRIFLKLFPHLHYVHEIDSRVIQKYAAIRRTTGGMGKGPVKESTLNREFGTLSDMFRIAVKWKYMDKETMPEIEFYEVSKKARDRRLTPAEIDQLLQGAWDPWRDLYVLGLICGLRDGEACHLRKDDVEVKLDTVRLIIRAKTWVDVETDGERVNHAWKPKTPTSTRAVAVPGKYHKFIKKLLKKNKGPWLVAHEDGRRVKVGVLSSMTRKFCRKLKMVPFQYRDLRHTWFSQSAESGSDVRAVSEQGGHSSWTTTQQTYTHFRKEFYDEEMGKLSYPIKTPL